MNEIFTNIEALIVMFAPVVLSYLTQIVDWIFTIKKFKALDLEKQLAPVLSQLVKSNEENQKLREANAVIIEKDKELEKLVIELSNRCKEIEDGINNKLNEQNDALCKIVKENRQLLVEVQEAHNEESED